MYKAWLSLSFPARDSRWRMTWPLGDGRVAKVVDARRVQTGGAGR
jgi:hypothetical protein